MANVKYALVLSGGGFKGAFQVGALEYIMEHGIHYGDYHEANVTFDIVAGVSVGSLNGAMVASDQFAELRRIWFEEIPQKGKEVIFESTYINDKGEPVLGNIVKDLIPKLGLWRIICLLFSRKKRDALLAEVFNNIKQLTALASNAPLSKRLAQMIKRNSFRDVCYLMGFVSLNNGRYYGVSHDKFISDEDLQNAILASTAMPIVWDPVPAIAVADEPGPILNSVDGGLRNVSPLGDVISKINKRSDTNDKYIIVIINTQAGEPKEWKADTALNLGKIAERSLVDITLSEIFNNDIELFTRINTLVKQAAEKGVTLHREKDGQQVPYAAYDCIIIQPKGHELGGTLDTTPDAIANRRSLGKLRAQEAMGQPLPDFLS